MAIESRGEDWETNGFVRGDRGRASALDFDGRRGPFDALEPSRGGSAGETRTPVQFMTP